MLAQIMGNRIGVREDLNSLLAGKAECDARAPIDLDFDYHRRGTSVRLQPPSQLHIEDGLAGFIPVELLLAQLGINGDIKVILVGDDPARSQMRQGHWT